MRELTEPQRALLGAVLKRHGIPTATTEARPLAPLAARPGAALTSRELEVLQLIAEGFSNTQIAAELVVSPETVKTHIRRLLAKLKATSRAHAVAVAFQTRLLYVDP